MGGAVEHLVIGRFFVPTFGTFLLVATEEDDHVVGRRGDRHHGQQVHREGGQLDEVVVAGESHHAAGHGQLQEHHHHRQQDGDDGAVDEQQHGGDDAEGQHGDRPQAAVAGDVGVGDQRRRAGDVGRHPGRRRHAFDCLLGGVHRLVGQRLAHVSGQIHLDIGGLAVGALRAPGGERVAPEILNVFNVFGVGVELGDDLVVVVVRIVAERLVALQDDHHRGVGPELVENLADAVHRDR